jgi:hypothetical protein
VLLIWNISWVPCEVQLTGTEKYRGGRGKRRRILCMKNTNMLFCTLYLMMKICWNLYIWFLNKFMMQVGRFDPFYRPQRPLGRIEV